MLPMGSWHFTGDFDKTVRFVQTKQLKDASVWKNACGAIPVAAVQMMKITAGAANIGES